MSDNANKIKLLKIVGFISSESSSTMPVTTNQIINYLATIDISCDRRTLYKDMNLLMDSGLGIVKTRLAVKTPIISKTIRLPWQSSKY